MILHLSSDYGLQVFNIESRSGRVGISVLTSSAANSEVGGSPPASAIAVCSWVRHLNPHPLGPTYISRNCFRCPRYNNGIQYPAKKKKKNRSGQFDTHVDNVHCNFILSNLADWISIFLSGMTYKYISWGFFVVAILSWFTPFWGAILLDCMYRCNSIFSPSWF